LYASLKSVTSVLEFSSILLHVSHNLLLSNTLFESI
jgi:hypothetical protein